MLRVMGNEEKWVAFSGLPEPSRAAPTEQYLRRRKATTGINTG